MVLVLLLWVSSKSGLDNRYAKLHDSLITEGDK